jgi:hypothetical protein
LYNISFIDWNQFGKVGVLEKWMTTNYYYELNLISLLIFRFVGIIVFFILQERLWLGYYIKYEIKVW